MMTAPAIQEFPREKAVRRISADLAKLLEVQPTDG
jgi:hypothetical protein